MPDYEATYTYQHHDYAVARAKRERWEKRHPGERMPFKLYKAPLVSVTIPNPLSMELRIVFGYLWNMYTDCLEGARIEREKHYPSEKAATNYERDAKEAVSYAYLLCHELFDVTSPHAPVHIHSEYGCKDDSCPSWAAGEEDARENVADWYTPDC